MRLKTIILGLLILFLCGFLACKKDSNNVVAPPDYSHNRGVLAYVEIVGNGKVHVDGAMGEHLDFTKSQPLGWVEYEPITFTFVPDSGFQFSGWEDSMGSGNSKSSWVDGTTNPLTTNLENGSNIKATFVSK